MSHFISSTIITGKETFFFFFNQVGKRESNENRTYNSSKTSPSRNHKPCSKTLGTFSAKVLPQTVAFLARLWTSSEPWIAAVLRVPGLPSTKARFRCGFHLTVFYFVHGFDAFLSPSNACLIAALTRSKPCVPVCYGRQKWHAEFSEHALNLIQLALLQTMHHGARFGSY